MKRSLYEGAAWVLALGGALMLGFGLFPCLNPIQWRVNLGPRYLPASLFSFAASFPIMWIAWRLSRQAQALQDEEQSSKQTEHGGLESTPPPGIARRPQ